MPEPLKNIYNPAFFHQLTTAVQRVLPTFNPTLFLTQVMDKDWDGKALKQRTKHISFVLHRHLPGGFDQQVSVILQVIGLLEEDGVKGGFEWMVFPDFIEHFGQQHPELSLNAMERITQFISCEFAVRPYLLQHQELVMARMLGWSRHPHPHVRRFASEGCRPRLPWGMSIPALKKDPSPILPILENLKEDPSLFVRKSVANNLNDIAKDNPEVVMDLVKGWKGLGSETDWIIRHGCRTLLKKAHGPAYALFGLESETTCTVPLLSLPAGKLRIGERLRFSFLLEVRSTGPSKVRLEYAIYYQKANGKQNRKIFQIAEKTLPAGSTHQFAREQRFEDFTTRKHYPGTHRIAIVVNGVELAEQEFMLLP